MSSLKQELTISEYNDLLDRVEESNRAFELSRKIKKQALSEEKQGYGAVDYFIKQKGKPPIHMIKEAVEILKLDGYHTFRYHDRRIGDSCLCFTFPGHSKPSPTPGNMNFIEM